ncbi:MAG: FAD-binding oxidoreductase [Acidimicrobiaceae bacterium]|nr:FAD-binding oxidoreductase [Acidimicrobiaceae bacterium]
MTTSQLGSISAIGGAAVASLRSSFSGELLTAETLGYDQARRVWNGNIDRHPALVARCTGVTDVREAVRFARELGLLVSVRGGGHSAPGYGTNEGGVVIDLSPMKGIRVDPVLGTVRAQGGVLWRELDRETQAFGLAVTGGTVSSTGIAGLTLGGGLGWLMGRHGLTVDNLLSADVVTADGTFHSVSAEREPDLFWALRGGGGNFGVVTSFEYRLHPVSEVLGGIIAYPLDQAGPVARFYRDFCAGLPDEAEAYLGFLTEPQAGIPIVALILGYNGDPADGERVLAPARKFGSPLVDLVGSMPYTARQTLLDEPNSREGLHRYWRSAFASELSDGLLDVLVDRAGDFTSPLSSLILFYLHGAAMRVSPGETAFSARRVQWDLDAIAQWADPAESERHVSWLRHAWSDIEPHTTPASYVNHISDDDRPEKVRASYGTNHDRLRRLKGVYDPSNLFRLNPNISPA